MTTGSTHLAVPNAVTGNTTRRICCAGLLHGPHTELGSMYCCRPVLSHGSQHSDVQHSGFGPAIIIQR